MGLVKKLTFRIHVSKSEFVMIFSQKISKRKLKIAKESNQPSIQCMCSPFKTFTRICNFIIRSSVKQLDKLRNHTPKKQKKRPWSLRNQNLKSQKHKGESKTFYSNRSNLLNLIYKLIVKIKEPQKPISEERRRR